jgi:hypothetical protein
MEVYISIDGVLRNLIQKFDYHYNYHFLETDPDPDLPEGIIPFDYQIKFPVQNDDLMDHFIFQSQEEYEYFLFVEFPLEIFGHAGVSYPTAISDLNKLMFYNKDINFTVIGLDEQSKARSSTLFFLSKNTFYGNNIKFIGSDDIEKEWEKCNLWITDNKKIIDKCPVDKTAIKFNTEYNAYFMNKIEINKIDESCLKSLERPIILT